MEEQPPPPPHAEDENSRERRFAEKLAPYPAEFRALVRAYRAAPSPGGLEAVVEGLLAHQLGESFHARRAELGDAARLVEDLRLDSLALVELSFAAEDFAGFAIQIEDFAAIKSLGDLKGFLRGKLFPAAGAGT